MPGLRVFRCLRPPFVRRVGIGPSFAKVPLDVSLAATALRRALSDAVRRGALARRRRRHRRGPRRGAGRAAPLRHALEPAAAAGELQVQPVARAAMGLRASSSALPSRRSRVVIVICPELERLVRELRPESCAGADRERARRRRRRPRGGGRELPCAREFGLDASTPLVLYTGTFEAYQGLDLLFDGGDGRAARAARRAIRCWPAARPRRSTRSTRDVRGAGHRRPVIFAGERPAERDSALPGRRRTCSCRRAAAARTRRSRSISTSARAASSWPRGCSRTRRCSTTSVAILTDADAGRRSPAGILQAIGDPAAAARDRRRGGATGRHEVQLRGVPGAHARGGRPSRRRDRDGDRCPGAPRDRARLSPGRQARITTATPSTPIRRWPTRSTARGSAGRSASCWPRRRRAS